MSYSATGKLHKAFDTEQKTENFRAREFVLEIEQGQYPQLIKFQLTQDRCDMLDHWQEGDEISVQFDLRGREWNGKFFTNLNAWRLEAPGQSEQATEPEARSESAPAKTVGDTPDGLLDEDIPF